MMKLASICGKIGLFCVKQKLRFAVLKNNRKEMVKMSYLKFSFSGYSFEPRFEHVLEAIENSRKTRIESYGRNDYAFIGNDITLKSLNDGRWVEDASADESGRHWSELLIKECEITNDGEAGFFESVSIGFVCIDNYYEYEDKKVIILFIKGSDMDLTIRHVEEATKNVYQREARGGLHIGRNKYNTAWIKKQEDGTWIDRNEKIWGNLFVAEVDEKGNVTNEVSIGLTRLDTRIRVKWL